MEATAFYLLMLWKNQFKAKDSGIKDYTLCLGSISKAFTTNNMKQIRVKRKCLIFFCWF